MVIGILISKKEEKRPDPFTSYAFPEVTKALVTKPSLR